MRHLERSEQCVVIQWAKLHECRYPELTLLYHIGNGGSRNIIEASNLKRAGVRAGMPDLALPVARHNYNALFIELKVGKGKLSEAQESVIKRLQNAGNYVHVAYGADDAIEKLKWYISIDK